MIEKRGFNIPVPMVDTELVEVSRTPPTADEQRNYQKAKRLLKELEATGLFWTDYDGGYGVHKPNPHVVYKEVPCEPRPAWEEGAGLVEIVNKTLLLDYGYTLTTATPNEEEN